jgi:UDP-galactopyranose mutase
LAAATEGVHFVGRLATYKYYNMDQVVAQALTLVKHLTATHSALHSASANGHSWSAQAATA